MLLMSLNMKDKKLKLAIIAGASKALSLKESSPFSSQEEVIKQVTKELDNMDMGNCVIYSAGFRS